MQIFLTYLLGNKSVLRNFCKYQNLSVTRANDGASNEQKSFGAVWVLDMEKMASIREQIGDFYILPSSVHETILVKISANDEMKDPVSELNRMVMEVNATEVADAEILANHIYKVDWEKGGIVSLETGVEDCGCTLDEADGLTGTDAVVNQGISLTVKA